MENECYGFMIILVVLIAMYLVWLKEFFRWKNKCKKTIVVELLFEDHYSLKYYRVWDYFRDEHGQLYMLINRVMDENKIIGYEGRKVDNDDVR